MTYTYRCTVKLIALAFAAHLASCKEEPPPRREPPPPAAKKGNCNAPRRANDPRNIRYFPPKSDGFCLDPNGSDKGFGQGAKSPINGICNLFDGECEIYKYFKVKRVVEVRYVDGAGSGATIDVYLSQFETDTHAYGMFTKRVVGDGDPAHADTPKPISGGGAAVLGIGNAYLWRGRFLAELTYNDDKASAKVIRVAASKRLPGLVKALGDKLDGNTELPPSAKALPATDRILSGIRMHTKDVLSYAGMPAGALGYYKSGKKRWRVLSIVAADKAQAEDVFKTLGASGKAREKGIGDSAARIVNVNDVPTTEWIIARKGSRLIGIGDERLVLREGMGAAEHRAVSLNQDEKRAKLKKLLD